MIKVFNINDLIKYVTKILLVFIIMFFLVQFFSNKSSEKNKNKSAMLFCIDDYLTLMKAEKNKEKDNLKIVDAKKYAFLTELKVMKSLKENIIEDINSVNLSNEETSVENTSIDENAKVTEVINDGVNPRTTDDFEGVLINNSTYYTLTYDMLNPNVEVNKNKIVIYHTHTSESYTPTEQNQYQSSGTFRTIDLNYSVSRVGDELENNLKSFGFEVIHDKTFHDYPAYNGSYSRSLITAKNILSNNKDAEIVIDLHRDAIADETYAPKVKIGDEYVSQLMFVIGSDGANPAHVNWLQNLKFAIKVQKKANELYPGLFKPIILRNSEYNQSIAKCACIIEVGATGNTLEESMGAMKYLAKIMNEV